MKKIIVAIDGFAACGKSTLAKDLAKKLHYAYIDTGAMYRAVTYYLFHHGVNLKDIDQVGKALPHIHIRFERNSQGQNITMLNDEIVEEAIRSLEITTLVDEISKYKPVREAMVAQQRRMGKDKGVVLDGRDIGTVVFPQAELKLFITSDMNVRVQRRLRELIPRYPHLTAEDVESILLQRDQADLSRIESPLKKANDAIEIDNSWLTREEQLGLAFHYASKIIS